MFDTVGRYRDPEGPLRRLAAGCLTLLAVGGTIGTILAVMLARWLWPWIKALLLFILNALFGRAPSFLLDPIVVPEMAIAEIEVGLVEPYAGEDAPLEIPPLPGQALPEPSAELAALDFAVLAAMQEGPPIAHLRGWNDDDEFAIREEVIVQEELVAMSGLIGLMGSSSDSGVFDSVLTGGSGGGGMWGDEIGDSLGTGGLGLSGIGQGAAASWARPRASAGSARSGTEADPAAESGTGAATPPRIETPAARSGSRRKSPEKSSFRSSRRSATWTTAGR